MRRIGDALTLVLMLIGTVETPLGRMGLVEEDGAIVRLLWHTDPCAAQTDLLVEGCRQMDAYFKGELTEFDLPLRVAGSDFQRAVCDQMLAIPLGETRTYGDIAKALNCPAQPVGNACGANPIPVIIPCHRVLGANGLGGFSGLGGVETKVELLKHEGAAGLLI